MGNGLSKVRNGAIKNCTALKYVYISESIEKVGRDFLYGCKNVHLITNGTAYASLGKLHLDEIFILDDINSYDYFIVSVEENQLPYQSFVAADLTTTGPNYGKAPIELRSG